MNVLKILHLSSFQSKHHSSWNRVFVLKKKRLIRLFERIKWCLLVYRLPSEINIALMIVNKMHHYNQRYNGE